MKNYNQYIEDLNKLKAEQEILSSEYAKKSGKIYSDITNITIKLYKDVHDYVESVLKKRFEVKKYVSKSYNYSCDIYMINDQIYLRLLTYNNKIVLEIVYYDKDKDNYKFGNKQFTWYYNPKEMLDPMLFKKINEQPIDDFINDTINTVENMYNARVNAQIKRLSKKYNIG